MQEVGTRLVLPKKRVEVAAVVCLSGALMCGRSPVRGRQDSTNHTLAKSTELVSAESSLPRELGAGLGGSMWRGLQKQELGPLVAAGGSRVSCFSSGWIQCAGGAFRFPFLIFACHAGGHRCISNEEM